MESVLVTGGAGFIGANTCNILAAASYKVVALDNLALGNPASLGSSVKFVEGDIAAKGVLDQVGPVDFVIHLAGSSSAPMFETDLEGSVVNNIIGHLKVLEFARQRAVKKVLFASTSSIYGNNPVPLMEDQPVTPPNFYAVSKHSMEELSGVYSARYGLEILGFRFMSVYGLHEEHKGQYANLVSQFIWGIEQGKAPVVYGDGKQDRDFTNVRDIVAAFLLALRTEKRFGFEVFNIGTGRAVNMHELIAVINAAMGTCLPPKCIPNPVGKGYVMQQLADLGKIRRELRFEPTVWLEQGIREIVEHRRRHPITPRSLSY